MQKQYNSCETLLVISPYPNIGETYSKGMSGVASYTKNVLQELTRPVVIIAPYTEKPQEYQEGNIFILCCFANNTLGMWVQILNVLLGFTKVQHVLIQFDFTMYGGILVSGSILPFLFFLKLLGFKTTIVLHHVVLDITKLSGHVGLEPQKWLYKAKSFFYNLLFRGFYKSIGILADTIIVLEKTLQEKLNTIISEKKTVTIPHGVDTSLQPLEKMEARKQLGISPNKYVVLFFGYINWFKGADFFAKTFKQDINIEGKKIYSIIAGGISPTLCNKKYYQNYVTSVLDTVETGENITITGYIPQEKIGMYFSACDLIILPYRYYMTASGVLSLIFSYKKPFLISQDIAEMFDTEEFTSAFLAAGIKKQDITFCLTSKSCIQKTKNILQNQLLKNIEQLTNIIREQRSYKQTALLYEKEIFTPNYAKDPDYVIGYNKKLMLSPYENITYIRQKIRKLKTKAHKKITNTKLQILNNIKIQITKSKTFWI